MSNTVPIVIAVVSFVGTVVTAGFAAWMTYYSDERKRRSATNKLLAKYRDPLLLAAYDLQSRIYNIETHGWEYLGGRGNYLQSHTCFLIGQYLAWVYILRREALFTCFETESENMKLADQLKAIETQWSSSGDDSIWELWRGQQIGIGELLTVEGNSGQLNCMGYVAFTAKWKDEEFRAWFSDIHTDINYVRAHRARSTAQGDIRLYRLQNLLADLIVILDKKGLERHSGMRKLGTDNTIPQKNWGVEAV